MYNADFKIKSLFRLILNYKMRLSGSELLMLSMLLRDFKKITGF